MSDLIKRTEKTADGLRSKLFDVLDALIEDKISIEQVEAVCAVSDQIIKSARVELEIQIEQEAIDQRKDDRLNGAVKMLSKTMGDNNANQLQ